MDNQAKDHYGRPRWQVLMHSGEYWGASGCSDEIRKSANDEARWLDEDGEYDRVKSVTPVMNRGEKVVSAD